MFRDLNVEIQEGKVTTIIGPNGCKSTLLKTMGRILKQKAVKYICKDRIYIQFQRKKLRSSFTPANPIAPGELKVEELILWTLSTSK